MLNCYNRSPMIVKQSLAGRVWRRALSGLALAATLLCAPVSHGAMTIEIVGGASHQIPIAIVPFAYEGNQAQKLSEIVSADLLRSGLFKMVDPRTIAPQPHDLPEVRYADWRALGADALAVGSIVTQLNGSLDIRFRLLDTVKQSQLAGFSYSVPATELRATAHKIADAIYEKLTGDAGVFSTRIAYVLKQGKKYELQVADADGENARTILTSYEPLMSPAWSPDGEQIAYVAFEGNGRNIRPIVYVQSLQSGRRRILASHKGNNSAPAWSPDGKRLAIALTLPGNTQIYLVNADGSGLARWTSSGGTDTEPNWSPDGKWIIFTSDRGGGPQIYRMPANGGPAERKTFEGGWNTTPRFSPDGKSFTFTQRSGNQDHVAVQDIETGQVQVLTDTPQDESPSFAPNGKMILYATRNSRRGILSVVSSDGRSGQRLSVQTGDVYSPAWGPLKKTQLQ